MFDFLVQKLHAINLGDSGFVVIRDGRTIFKSQFQQHGFNFTYQLESGNGGDLPSSGEVKSPTDITLKTHILLASLLLLFRGIHMHYLNKFYIALFPWHGTLLS